MARVIKYAMTTVVAIGLICAFAIFVLDIPLPWKTANAEDRPSHAAPASGKVQNLELLFLLTEQSPALLRGEGVPAAVIDKLAPLKGKLMDRDEFVAEAQGLPGQGRAQAVSEHGAEARGAAVACAANPRGRAARSRHPQGQQG